MMSDIRPKFIQINCTESTRIDSRQARAILKYKPDIVILEYPNNKMNPGNDLNNYPPNRKPIDLIKNLTRFSKETLKKCPWIKSDIIMWKNINKLWEANYQVLIYNVDGPSELVSELFQKWKNPYPLIKNNWLWWVQIYLREKFMTKNIQWVLDSYKEKNNPIICVFLQSFHWNHVKFLLSNHSNKMIWNYYFKRFSKEISKSNISEKIKENNKIFYKYWNKISDFK